MKKEQVLIGLGVATAMVTAFNGHAQADEVVNTRIEISKFIPVKDAIVWKYKTVKGKLYMRQYNSTTKKWIGEWRLVPGQ